MFFHQRCVAHDERPSALGVLLGCSRSITAGPSFLQPFDQLSAKRAMKALLGFKRQSNKLHTELTTVHPLNRAEVDGQCRWLMVEENTHAHVTAAKDLTISSHRTTLHRQVGQDPFADERRPTENDGILEWKPVVRSNIPTKCHHILPVSGWYRDQPWDRYPTLGG